MIYLASPYTHPDPDIRLRRFHAASKAAATIMRVGLNVFSPIVHSYPIAACGLDDMDHAFWMRVDGPYLEWCSAVFVLTLDGWRESKGIAAEIARAKALGKPVSFLSPIDLGMRDVPAAAMEVTA